MADGHSSKKRVHSPTGTTPHKPRSKRGVSGCSTGQSSKSAKKQLTYTSTKPLYTPVESWSEEEDKAITQFVLLSFAGDSWPSTKSTKLWEGASKFLHNTCKTVRTSKELAVSVNVYRSLLVNDC